jgi:beta-glucosidase
MDVNDFTPVKGMDEATITATIDAILYEATLEEKVAMMSGQGFFAQYMASGKRWGSDPYRAGGGFGRFGLEPFYFTDGPRGVARGHSTCFPCTMARGASFDADLETRIGSVMGVEIRAQGCSLSGAVCVNLLRHPAWGRAQETYGEDTHHLGVMGAALGKGIQAHNVAATVKHFALNSIENSRFKVDVRVDERTLREVYLPHFKHILDAGIMTVMSAYNKVNGEYCGESPRLLTHILRDEWGFQGFVHSDWGWGVYKVEGATAGLDVENPEPQVFGKKLIAAVEGGQVQASVVDQACRRILRVWYRIKCAADPLPAYRADMIAQESHRALALEAAEKSAVLLTNTGVLPLDRAKVATLAVLGRLASLENTGDNGSSRVRPPYVITALDGLQSAMETHGGHVVTGDEFDIEGAVKACLGADAAIIIAGYTARDEGEYIPGDIDLGQAGGDSGFSLGGDRASLDLPDAQIALIEAIATTGKPLIVVIVAGSAVMVERWHDKAHAILQTFYAGMEGGTALARLLFGDVSPSGRLPFTVARDVDHYPFFDCNADGIDYGYFHGYAKLIEDGNVPRFAFGHGLSYADFTSRDLILVKDGDLVTVSVTIDNVGTCAADHVVQCYIAPPGSIAPRAKHSLRAFSRVSLAPGDSERITLSVPIESLKHWDESKNGWALEPGRHQVMIMQSAGDPAPLCAEILLP